MLKGGLYLDEKDRKILTLLSENPEMSQSEIAERVGLSQPSVGARIKRLKQEGAISSFVGMNLKKTGLYLAKVDVTTKNTNELVQKFTCCPFFLNGFIVTGKDNLSLFFVSEDISTLEALVDNHIRKDPDVVDADFGIVIAPLRDFIMPVKARIEKTGTSPCNSDCSTCPYYEAERCLGCPLTDYYRGTFWE